MTNDLNDHFPHSLRSSLAEVLKTIETIGTIFFPCLRTLQSPSRSTLSLCQSKKRANIWGMFTACFCSPSSRTSCLLFCENPQVTFASLSSPAVMDIRPLRGRFLACGGFKDNRDNRDNIFSLLAHLSRVDRRWAVDGPALLNQPQHSTPLHKGRGEQPRGLRGGGAFTSSRTSLPPLSPPVPAFSSFSASAARRCARC